MCDVHAVNQSNVHRECCWYLCRVRVQTTNQTCTWTVASAHFVYSCQSKCNGVLQALLLCTNRQRSVYMECCSYSLVIMLQPMYVLRALMFCTSVNQSVYKRSRPIATTDVMYGQSSCYHYVVYKLSIKIGMFQARGFKLWSKGMPIIFQTPRSFRLRFRLNVLTRKFRKTRLSMSIIVE